MRRIPAFALAGLIVCGPFAFYAGLWLFPEIFAPILIVVGLAALWYGLYNLLRT